MSPGRRGAGAASICTPCSSTMPPDPGSAGAFTSIATAARHRYPGFPGDRWFRSGVKRRRGLPSRPVDHPLVTCEEQSPWMAVSIEGRAARSLTVKGHPKTPCTVTGEACVTSPVAPARVGSEERTRATGTHVFTRTYMFV